MTVKRRSWQTFYEPQHGKPKRIVVWRNGDFDSHGQEVVLHAKYLRSWNALLGCLTLLLEPRFGAVRRLYHLPSKKPVVCLQDIKADEKYVVAGGEKLKFKENGYRTENKKRSSGGSKQHDCSSEELMVPKNFMAYTKQKRRTVVYLMVSGRTCQAPLKVVLIESDLVDYNMILEYLSYRLDVGEGIQFLCTVNGKTISNLSELKHGQLYVAVPFCEKFIKLDYQKVFAECIPQAMQVSSLSVPTPPLKKKKKKLQKPVVSDSKQVEASDAEDMITMVDLVDSKIDNLKYLEERGFSFMKVKCVGTKCEDYNCRIHREEYLSKSSSFAQSMADYEEYMSSPMCSNTEAGGTFDTNWVAYEADLREQIGRLVEDVTIARDILKDLVQDTISQAERKSVTSSVAGSVASSIDTVEIKGRDVSFTTFAEIADRPTKQPFYKTSLRGSECSEPKKSVTFGYGMHPEIITSTPFPSPAPLDLSLLDLSKGPKVSILKSRDSFPSPKMKASPKAIPIVIRESFLRVKSSLSDENEIDVDVLRKLSVLLQREVDGEVIRDKTASVGVQRNWNGDEQIIDKGVQAAADNENSAQAPEENYYDTSRLSNIFYYSRRGDLSDIYDNFEHISIGSQSTNDEV